MENTERKNLLHYLLSGHSLSSVPHPTGHKHCSEYCCCQGRWRQVDEEEYGLKFSFPTDGPACNH